MSKIKSSIKSLNSFEETESLFSIIGIDETLKSTQKTNSKINFDPKVKLKIYTDGGCQNNGYDNSYGGCGFVVTQNDELVFSNSSQFKDTTNNQMELRGMIEALKWCAKNNIKNPIICSDSQYCINGCTIWKAKWVNNDMYKKTPKKEENRVINSKIWLELYSLQSVINPSFEWVKGHSGNKWNEMADELASVS